ncbi:MAG: penicillin-binding protein 2 [Candidatus Doudnabacteria bacterium]|nr:penicillin-binding protein 2 [Candidatus Doudnabacteria bacterium]
MSRDPFKLKIGKPVQTVSHGRFLEFDESSTDPRFSKELAREEKVNFTPKFWLVLLGVVFSVFLARILYLQVHQYERYLALAEGNRLRVQYVFAPRGLITDRFGKNIALNEPSFDLVFTPLDLPSDPAATAQVVRRVAEFFGLDENYLKGLVASADRSSFFPVTLKRQVERERALVFFTEENSFPGFSIQNNPKRNYIDGPVFAHMVGYTGKLNAGEYEKLQAENYLYNDEIGKEGLELQYEKFLRGRLGRRFVEVDARGKVRNSFEENPALPGAKLVLKLDGDLQVQLFNGLTKVAASRRAKRAAAVALDPQTGGVLALVSIPSFDNNDFASGISQEQYERLVTDRNFPLFNRVTSGLYPPGSVVKPFFASAALEEGVITEKTKINDTGALFVPNEFSPGVFQVFRGWNPAGLGLVDVYDAIALSSDIFFYTVGGGQKDSSVEGLGPVRMAEYLKKFSFGKVTGIDLPTEKSGLVPTPDWKKNRFSGDLIAEKWYLGDTYNMSIGQGFVIATPLQIAVATAAVANGGKILRPQLVDKVIDRDGKVLYEADIDVLESGFIASEYLEMVKSGMRKTVTEGTAKSLNVPSMSVAGKTGTSQFDGSDLSRTHAWFTAFAPLNNPKIVITVIIEAGGEGSGAAVPVAAEVLDWFAKNRN